MSTDRCSRRDCLRSLAGAGLILPGMVSELLADDDPLAPKAAHHPAKAKRVIFLFMTGGVSHVDSFDPKPALFADDAPKRKLLRPGWEFKKRGQCGTEISDLFPGIAEMADDLCVIRSMRNDHGDHFQATLGIHTGSVTFARPSLGSWLTYGLGTVNRNLPGFIVIAPALPYAGQQVYSSDFLPAVHQGVRVVPGADPIPNLKRRGDAGLQELELGLAEAFDRGHLAARGSDKTLAARIKSFETAAKMQAEAPEAFDLSKEPDETLALYGLKRGQNTGFGWQCLVSRRLAERGVRFIELIDVGAGGNWDAHEDVKKNHGDLARKVDAPIAGLLKDLKRTGLLDDTLVVWTTEFGRTPTIEGKAGRGHHDRAFSSWMAGGGVKGGIAWGRTDDTGTKVVENEVHLHDFHATLLHLMGLDHTRLTYRHAGRDFRLTDVAGRVVQGILR